MKKKLALLLCVILTLCVFVGCKGDKPTTTDNTSSKIETETVLDDKYANSEKPFSEYTLEEFEKLDISDKYVMVDICVDEQDFRGSDFEKYGVKSTCMYNRKSLDKNDYKALFELEKTGAKNVLNTIKKISKNNTVCNVRPVAYKEDDCIDFMAENKMQIEFEDIENTNTSTLIMWLDPRARDRYFTLDDFPEVEAMSINVISYNRMENEDNKACFAYITLATDNKADFKEAICALNNNKFVQRVAPTGYFYTS